MSVGESSTVASERISWHILRLLGLELETYFQNFLGFVFALMAIFTSLSLMILRVRFLSLLWHFLKSARWFSCFNFLCFFNALFLLLMPSLTSLVRNGNVLVFYVYVMEVNCFSTASKHDLKLNHESSTLSLTIKDCQSASDKCSRILS